MLSEGDPFSLLVLEFLLYSIDNIGEHLTDQFFINVNGHLSACWGDLFSLLVLELLLYSIAHIYNDSFYIRSGDAQ